MRYRKERVHYDNHFTSLEEKAAVVKAMGRGVKVTEYKVENLMTEKPDPTSTS